MNWLEPVKNQLSLRTIEHSLCEFSKYWLQKHNVGKNRLEYDRWKNHPNCTIETTGRHLVFNVKVYTNFEQMSDIPCPPSIKYEKFKKKKNITKEDYINFVTVLQDKFTD